MYWLDSVFAAWRESVLGVQVAVTGFRFDSKAPRKLKPSVTPIALCQLGHDRIMNAVCLYPACLHIARRYAVGKLRCPHHQLMETMHLAR